MLHMPKPLLTANIYCDRHLDDVVARLISPFWSEVKEVIPSSIGYLWLMRYSRCGEHLKVRLHAGEEHRDWLVATLEERTRDFFAALPVPAEPQERIHNAVIPPLDPEDAADEPYPDRSLLWTDYRPSPITVGSEVMLPDQRLLALFTRTLAAGTDLVLDGFRPDAKGEYSWRMRQNLAIKIVVTLLAGLDFDLPKVHEYLSYHRDWLIRYMVFRGSSTATAEELLARYDARARETPAALTTLRQVLEGQTGPQDLDGDDAYSHFSRRVRDLYGYIARYRTDPGPALDPYAQDQVYLPIFKCLHGLGNQIGLGMAREGQLYHLLATAVEADAAPRLEEVA